jgi:hypothetical protein
MLDDTQTWGYVSFVGLLCFIQSQEIVDIIVTIVQISFFSHKIVSHALGHLLSTCIDLLGASHRDVEHNTRRWIHTTLPSDMFWSQHIQLHVATYIIQKVPKYIWLLPLILFRLINLFGICLQQKSVVERKEECKFLISIHVIVAIVQMHGWREINFKLAF